MDKHKYQFLREVVGDDGAAALIKATDSAPDLAWAIFPRVVMSWLEVVSLGEYDGGIPGMNGTNLALNKSEAGFTGAIDLGSVTYEFENASLYHVAGSVAVALGVDQDRAPALMSPALAKLGKSIDLLVRSRTLRKAQAAHQGGAQGKKLPGQTAAPTAPKLPEAPISVQPEMTGDEAGAVGTKQGTAIKPRKQVASVPKTGPDQAPTAAPKLPGIKPKKPQVKVTKAESKPNCPVCDWRHFKNDKYVGCTCFQAMAKSVKTTVIDGGYMLEFGSEWDADAIMALVASFGK
jgi:hypothetical protein